jgi:hypothetical protein
MLLLEGCGWCMQADWAHDGTKSTDEETGHIELINTRINKALKR